MGKMTTTQVKKMNDAVKDTKGLVIDQNSYIGKRIPAWLAMLTGLPEAFAMIMTAQAFDYAGRIYPNITPDDSDDEREAFLQGLWSASLAHVFGDVKAEEITRKYEDLTVDNEPLDRQMDEFNNRVGREMVVDIDIEGIDELVSIIKQGIDTGKFIKINKEPLIPTTKI